MGGAIDGRAAPVTNSNANMLGIMFPLVYNLVLMFVHAPIIGIIAFRFEKSTKIICTWVELTRL